MPELNSAQETALRSIVETLGPALSNTISENIGRLALVDDPTAAVLPLSGLMKDAAPIIQVNWVFPVLGHDECMLVLSGIDALELAATIGGLPAPETELTDTLLAQLKPVVEGIALGFGIALGNATSRPIHAQSIVCSAAPISVGSAFVTADQAVAIQVTYHVEEGPNGTITFYMTPDVAASLAQDSADATPGMSGEAASHSMAGSFFGGHDAGAGFGADMFGAPTMPGAPMSGAMGGPLAGGPFAQASSPFQAFEPSTSMGDGVLARWT